MSRALSQTVRPLRNGKQPQPQPQPPEPDFDYQCSLVNKAIDNEMYEAAFMHCWVFLEYYLKKHQYETGSSNVWPKNANYRNWKFVQNERAKEHGGKIRATLYSDAETALLPSIGYTVVQCRNEIVHNGLKVDKACFLFITVSVGGLYCHS